MFFLKKVLPLVLLLAMVLTMFAACNGSSDPKETGTESESETESTTNNQGTESGSETDPGDVKTSILDGITFPDTVVTVLCEAQGNLSEYVEEMNDSLDVVDKAVYDRCDSAENRLQLRSKWEVITAGDTYREKAELENNNGGEWDVMDSQSQSASILMARGVFSNLMNYTKYLDFEHPGWSQSLVNDIKVGNKLYFATGDISTNLMFMTGVVFFNKGLVKDLGINAKIQTNWGYEDLYELVTEGKWTLDKMITLSENVYKDQNNNGKKDSGDRFGFTSYASIFPSFYWGGGYKAVEVVDGGFEISKDYLNPELVGNILTKINDLFYTSKDGMIEGGYSSARNNFAAGNILFTMGPASHAWYTYSSTEDLEYSVLPVPKHSESQERYCASQSVGYLLASVASQAKHADAAAAFIQALTEESYEITRPALFDKLMKGRYAEDPEDAEMWEYAIDANVFDIGRLYGHFFTNDGETSPEPERLFVQKIKDNNNNWAQIVSGNAGPLSIMAATLAGQIAGLPD